jgi:gliding motility-associated-like protein
LCGNETLTLNALQNDVLSYKWFKNGNLLSGNTGFELQVENEGIYSVEVLLDNGCTSYGSIQIEYSPLPIAIDSALVQCDTDGVFDGLTTFNLTQINETLINNNPNREVKFYTSLSSAQNSIDEIDGTAFNNSSNPQVVYAQLIDTASNCFDIAELTLSISTSTANDAVLESCDLDGSLDGFYNFTLSDANADVLLGLPTSFDLNYYETYQDALLEVNPLAANYTNTTAYNQTIFARVENGNDCHGINQVELVVYKLPELVIQEERIVCLNAFPSPITLDAGIINGFTPILSYDWSTGETTPQIQVNVPGTYTVNVTNSNGCSKLRTITVLPSNIATFDSIDIIDGVDNNTVTIFVFGEGEYEYALDTEFTGYQDSNQFSEVTPGYHTVYVRDKNDCGTVKKNIAVIGFPKFFTPNGDGYNDTWHVYGINTPDQVNSEIYIFDRFGKLLIKLSPSSAGWDGTLNGVNTPSSDYWFYIKLQNNKIFKGHFSLKR